MSGLPNQHIWHEEDEMARKDDPCGCGYKPAHVKADHKYVKETSAIMGINRNRAQGECDLCYAVVHLDRMVAHNAWHNRMTLSISESMK